MSMGPDKSPGPDGFNPAFYQDIWEVVGPDICRDCRKWLSTSIITPDAQATTIILLPKTDKPETMKDLRPISLCDVRYRILAKVLANRIRRLMPHIIKEEQSAFVQGRSIVDNILITFESLHSMSTKPCPKVGDVALKMDISKVYDRVEWKYLEQVLLTMGFSATWVTWMLMCVRSVRYSVSINNSLHGNFQPTRGLRQGCPLSPFLFILCAEGLTSMIRKASLEGYVHGYRVCRQAPPVSHLLFADDSIFFFKASIQEARKMRTIFDAYSSASGQLINFEKSGIFFNKGLDTMMQQGISALLNIHNPFDTSRYLGVPVLVGKNRSIAFQTVYDRMWQKLQTWQGKKLSRGGKEVLLKAVAQALPAYSMNVFLLPDLLTEDLERMMNSFWWGSKRMTGK
ncbi:LINE-1 retrotransposable element ORF2 protein [Linum grandiflorum]